MARGVENKPAGESAAGKCPCDSPRDRMLLLAAIAEPC